MTNWKTYKVGDLYSIASGLSKSRSEFGFGYPFVTFKDVFYNFFIPAELESLANTTEKERTTCSVKRGDIFLTRTSETMHELGMSAVSLKDYENATFNGFTKRLRLKEKVTVEIDPVFIGYYFRTTHIRNQIGMHATMTTRASLNSTAINSIEITIPEIEVQKRIGEILKSIDDKIELNRRMNQTLEQMAQTLFRQYFVDGIDEENLPEGWRVGKLGDIVDVKGGTTPSTKQPEFWNGSINWTSPKDLSSVRFPVLLDTEKKISEAGLKKISSGLLPVGTLLLSSRAPIGYLAITQIPVAINQGYIAILCEKGYSNYFMLFWLKENMSTIIQNANGSTFLEISKSVFKSIDLSIPPDELVQEFDAKVDALFQKLVLNEKESIKLTQLRDTLLPKLMSGEIDVMQTKSEELHEPVLS